MTFVGWRRYCIDALLGNLIGVLILLVWTEGLPLLLPLAEAICLTLLWLTTPLRRD
jgi:hypothetical protein